MGNIILTYLVGLCFGWLFLKLKVPGGMMVGAIVSVSMLSIFWGAASMPGYAKLAAQTVAGAFIGCSIEKSDLMKMRYIYKPALVLMLAMFLTNLVLGVAVYLVSPMDLLTSLLSAVPGGVSDTPLIASDMGADSAKVAVMQFFRMMAGIGLFPSAIAWVTRHEAERGHEAGPSDAQPAIVAAEAEENGAQAQAGDQKQETGKPNWRALTLILAVAAVFGAVGKWSNFPSGTLLFSLVAVIALKFVGISAVMPRWIRRVTQVLAGAYIGASVRYQDVLDLKMLALPTIIVVAGYFVNNLVTGRLLSDRFGMSRAEGMLAVNPAGASDMALISADIGVHSPDVNVLQIIRMLSAVSVYPQIMHAIALFFS